LSEIANDINSGITIYEDKLPLEKQVAAACEILGLDPLYVANEGVFIAIVDAKIADEVIAVMNNDDKGRNAVCIGEITEDHPNKVVMHGYIGGKRIITPLIGEQLPRIC
jgi:hydrogenase expression/formation protein HypE